MKPVVLLRVAAISLLLIFVGHSVSILAPMDRGLAEQTVLEALRAYSFDMLGSTRSHWDFYRGSSMAMSLYIGAQVAILWILSGMAKTNQPQTKSLIAVNLVATAGLAGLSFTNFFIVPAVCATIASVALLIALIKLPTIDT